MKRLIFFQADFFFVRPAKIIIKFLNLWCKTTINSNNKQAQIYIWQVWVYRWYDFIYG